jgi:hypothetical protein
MAGDKLSKSLPYSLGQSYCTVPEVSKMDPASSVCTTPIIFKFQNAVFLSVHCFKV